MTSTVATEIPQAPAPSKPLLETSGKNERMWHIPHAAWIIEKVDGDLRRRVDVVCSSFEQLAATDPARALAEPVLQSLCRAFERLAEVAKHGRQANGTGDIAARVREAVQHAVTNLRTMDETLFGRRCPFHTFERSKAEPLVGALLAAIDVLHRAIEILRKADASLDERLLDGLVKLDVPLRIDPIAV